MPELRPYQQEAVNAVYEHLRTKDTNPCVVLPTGCHAKGHPILMYDGSVKKVEDIVVGDLLMGPDSKPRRVMQLARGHEPMAEIRPIKGEPFIVNENHILSLVSTNEGKGKYPSQQHGGEITNISVSDYLGKSKSWKHLRKLYRVPIDFHNTPNLPIPPYILGLLLGDGCITKGVEYTTADPELADVFREYVESQGCHVSTTSNGSKALTYHAVKAKGAANPMTTAVRQLELYGCTSLDKFIPQMYLTAGRRERLELLAGLCDTDGYYTGIYLDYVTQSKSLAEDIVFLARSLGFCATLHEKFCRCQTGHADWYYRIFISGDFSVIPFRRNRHVPKPRRQKKSVLRTGFDVELLPDDDFYGFALDGDHLYVDGNFIVHHNTGKSLVLAKIASDAVTLWGGRVLILAHVKELLEQNADKVRRLCPELKVGVYSAGLNSRDTRESVIVAGIQSVYNKADKIGAVDLIIVDEAHMIGTSDCGEGMYRTFLKDMKVINPNVRLIGLTATPFRLKGGAICKPENLLNEVCYEAGLKEMIAQGYLSPLVSRAGRAEADLSSVHTRAGEFVQDELASAMDDEKLVDASCSEIAILTRERKSVLIFCTSVAHCKHVGEAITRHTGKECAVVTGETPAGLRAEIIARFRGEHVPADLFGTPKPPLKYLANCSVLTTGFDAPNTDCVVLMRPTQSAGLLLQMAGRGTRLSPETGKQNCLILDYGGNIMRHGPLDMIKAKEPGKGGGGDAPAKTCPECHAIIHAGYGTCPECGHVFPPPERSNLTEHASKEGVLSGEIREEHYDVRNVYYEPHVKRNAEPGTPRTMRVDYEVAPTQYKSEWVCPEHTGYARSKFERWWRERACPDCPVPNTVDEAVAWANAGALAVPKGIVVRWVTGEKFDRIVKVECGDRPEMTDELMFAIESGPLTTPSGGCPENLDDDELPF